MRAEGKRDTRTCASPGAEFFGAVPENPAPAQPEPTSLSLGVAPEIDPVNVRGDSAFRQEFDLDSMDFLNFVIALHRRLGVDVPERDYGKLTTLDDAVDYLAERVTS